MQWINELYLTQLFILKTVLDRFCSFSFIIRYKTCEFFILISVRIVYSYLFDFIFNLVDNFSTELWKIIKQNKSGSTVYKTIQLINIFLLSYSFLYNGFPFYMKMCLLSLTVISCFWLELKVQEIKEIYLKHLYF